MTFIKNHFLYILCAIAILFWFMRGFIFFFDPTPLWYDPGLYRILFTDYIKNLPDINFDNLAIRNKTAYPPFLWLLTTTLHSIGYTPDFLLNFGILFFSMLTIFPLYLFTKHKLWREVALLSVIIFCISITQYHSFLLNYFKQILWIILMLSAFFLLEKKKYTLSFPIILSLFTIHRPTWVFFLVIFLIYSIGVTIKSKKVLYIAWIFIVIAWMFAIGMYIPFVNTLIIPLIEPLTTTVLATWRSGTYLLKDDFWFYNLFIIIPSIYTLYIYISKKKFDIYLAGYIWWLLWVWLKLFFYTRMYIFFDIFIIIFAAIWLAYISKYYKKIFFIFFTSFFILQSSFYLWYVYHNGKALIPQEELEFIQQIPTIVPQNSIIMVTNSNYSPWLAWYAFHDTIAPWLFEWDIWDKSKWKTFWISNGNTKCNMLQESYATLNRPLYVWTGKNQHNDNFKNGSCFEIIEKKNWFLFQKITFEHDT